MLSRFVALSVSLILKVSLLQSVEVAWGIRFNHGGGCSLPRPPRFLSARPLFAHPGSRFLPALPTPVLAHHGRALADQYRLCPSGQPLTEECMQKMPLEFDRKAGTSLLWQNGSRCKPH